MPQDATADEALYTRLIHAFSEKAYNVNCAKKLYIFHFNFVRPHTTETMAELGKPLTPSYGRQSEERSRAMANYVIADRHGSPVRKA